MFSHLDSSIPKELWKCLPSSSSWGYLPRSPAVHRASVCPFDRSRSHWVCVFIQGLTPSVQGLSPAAGREFATTRRRPAVMTRHPGAKCRDSRHRRRRGPLIRLPRAGPATVPRRPAPPVGPPLDPPFPVRAVDVPPGTSQMWMGRRTQGNGIGLC